MHEITVDPTCTMIESRLSGSFSVPEVFAYESEVEPIIRRCAAEGGYRMMIDVSECVVQSQEVVAAFQGHVADMPRAWRLAVVTGDSAVRLQVGRIMQGSGIQMFADRDDALAWLSLASMREGDASSRSAASPAA